MGYDSLSDKVEKYVKTKKDNDYEFELLSEEEVKLAEIQDSNGQLDSDIQVAFQNVQRELDAEREILLSQAEDLEAQKSELTDTINDEIDKIAEVQGRLDPLKENKYAGGSDRIEEKCNEILSMLDALLDKIDASSTDHIVDGVAIGEKRESTDFTSYSTASIDHNTATIMSRYAPIMGHHSIENDLLATNPNYSRTDNDSPWNNNCQRCVSAYEARRRGYDVHARPIPPGEDYLPIMRHPQGWPNVYKNAELIDCSANSGTAAAINVEEQMRNWGDNCRAIVRVRWKPEAGGSGHVFIAERTNGVTRFVDPQNGNADASSYFELAKGSDLYCMRIDNLEFTDRIHLCCQ